MIKNKKKPNIDPDDNFLKWFQYHLNHTPGFASFVKILLFFIFSLILIIFGRVAVHDAKVEREEAAKTTTVAPHQKTAYKTLIDKIVNYTTTVNITIGDNSYIVENMKYKDGDLSGLFESASATKKFKVINDNIYEIVLGDTVENNDLFGELNPSFIIPKKLINILETNKSTKTITSNNVTYTYNIDVNEKTYTIEVIIISDKVNTINITNELEKYILTFEG